MKKLAIVLTLCLTLTCILAGCGTKPVERSGATACIPSPLRETDPDGLMEQLGLRFGTVDNAENVMYFVVADTLGEMDFTVDGIDLCARVQPATEFTDISGMYYDFETEEDIAVGSCSGKRLYHEGENESAEIILWFDTAPGIMYSLSGQGEDLSGIDFTAIAEQVYSPMQGNAG